MRIGIAWLALLAACAPVGPDYERPPVELPLTIPETASVTSSETGIRITNERPWDRWWEVFKDAQLDRLVEDARIHNKDLHAAIARVHGARAIVRQSFAPLLPTIGATGQYAYQRQSRNAFVIPQGATGTGTGGTGIGGGTGGATGSSAVGFSLRGEPFQLWSGTGDMSYELDLWGRVRRGLEAATAEEQATDEDRKSVELTVISEVAQAYFDLGAAEQELEIAREGVEIRTHSLKLVRGRLDAGLAPELELRRAEAELARASADVPEAERRRAVAEHRLAVLLGRMPTLRFAGRPPAEFDLPPEIPAGIPSALLQRRPDVRAAEERVRANNARIGQAIAGFFPTVTILGRFGYASVDASTIAQGPSQLFSIGPSIRIPIFEGGLTWARVLEAEARTDESTANYIQTVLQAFREVADAIVGISAHARVRDRQLEQVVAARRSVELATIEYDQGLTNYLNVLDAQRTLLDARRALLQAQRQLLQDIVVLQKALGGGWSELEKDALEEKVIEPVTPH